MARPTSGKTRWTQLEQGTPSWRTLLVIVVIVAAHVYGWHVTQINLVELVRGLPNMRHIVLGLLTPDLLERVEASLSAEAPLQLGCPAQGEISRRIPTEHGLVGLTVRPACAQAGDTVTVLGEGFPAGKEGQVFLVDRTGYSRPGPRFTVGPDGRFVQGFIAPAGSGEYRLRVVVRWPLNWWRPSETLLLTARLMVETIFLALMGTTLAVLITLPLSFLGARNLMRGSRLGMALYYATRTLFNVLRSVEVMIIAVIMVVVVGIGPFAGVLAIVVHSIGALGKLYSEAIEGIDPGPIEAITATGANRIQVIAYAVVPQVVPQFIAFTLYRWDINVRMSTIIGFVGGGGIGYILIQYINLLQWNQAATAIWLITAVVMAMDLTSALIRERLA